jgi:hypothetical protein
MSNAFNVLYNKPANKPANIEPQITHYMSGRLWKISWQELILGQGVQSSQQRRTTNAHSASVPVIIQWLSSWQMTLI